MAADIFNRNAFLERLGGDEALMGDLLEIFLDDTPHQISALYEAVENNRAEDIRLQAHTIKGSAANIGAPALKEAALNMENSGRDGDTSNAVSLFLAVKKEYARLEAVLNQEEVLPDRG